MAFADRYRSAYSDGTADKLVKTGEGVLHTLILNSDAAATAGTLTVRDGIDTNGAIIDVITFIAAYFPPVCLTYDVEFKTGLFLDWTTTGDVTASVSFK